MTKKIISYAVVTKAPEKDASNGVMKYRYTALEKEIEELLSAGWELHGTPFCVGETTRVAQAMILRGV